MPKNLDIAALRSFVAVADSGGITHAAEQMHLTQSAVSMQVKRLEDLFDGKMLQRKGRGVVLTPLGEQLLSYARRMIALNDEAWAQMTNDDLEGEVSFGVPVDILEPEIPLILNRCKQLYPRISINLISSLTKSLRRDLESGQIDIILTTELALDEGGETLIVESNDWYGAHDGIAHLQRPLPIPMCQNCAMRPSAIKALDDANVPWTPVGVTDNESTVDTLLAADLAITPKLRSTTPHAVLLHDESLPELPSALVNMYMARQRDVAMTDCIADVIREVFFQLSAAA